MNETLNVESLKAVILQSNAETKIFLESALKEAVVTLQTLVQETKSFKKVLEKILQEAEMDDEGETSDSDNDFPRKFRSRQTKS